MHMHFKASACRLDNQLASSPPFGPGRLLFCRPDVNGCKLADLDKKNQRG